MKVSVIIPTYNEAGNISDLIRYLKKTINRSTEIIVVDGGSKDNTREESEKAGAKVLLSPKKGRGSQMNYASSQATGTVLYFLHADSYPPSNFLIEIENAVKSGYLSGCFRLSFDYKHWFLKLNSWFTRFDSNLIRFGDQSLFVGKDVFIKTGGFRENLIVMEDLEIVPRIRKHAKFKVLSGTVKTSARKYLENGIYRLQVVFFIIYFMYRLGFSQEKLVKTYRVLIKQNKV